jgi:hypothetical protein
MLDQQQETKPTLQEYWKGFPEAPFSDTFKWVDADGFEHMTTVRGWGDKSLSEGIAKAKALITSQNGKPAGKFSPAPSAEPVMVQMTDENGTPLVDQNQEPIREKIDGARVYTVEGVAHSKTTNGKDVLKVFTVEREEFISRKYGVTCFHAPAPYKDFKNWPVDTKYGPKEGAMHVVITAPSEASKYANVVEFRA